MDTRTDAELIEEGRKHVSVIQHAQLELGKLALEFAPIGEASVKTGKYERLHEYADAIGIDFGSLRNYRACASAWLEHDHEGITYTALKALAPVVRKKELVALMRATDPPTKSGRWTAPAAVDLARANGLYSDEEPEPGDSDVLSFVRRTMGGLARLSNAIDVDTLEANERRELAGALTELTSEISTLRERLTGHRGATGDRGRRA